MKIGQTSVVVFSGKLLSSILGFAATIYFARELGPEVIGVYASVLAVVSWLTIITIFGVGEAVRKRISEGTEVAQHLAAGLSLMLASVTLVTLGLIGGQQYMESYIESFSSYIDISVVWFLIGLLIIQVGVSIVGNILQGKNLVHIDGALQPVKVGGRSVIQITLVAAGMSLLGMLVGYAVGGLLVIVLGLFFVFTRLKRPTKKHFRSIGKYAKFSWFGSLKAKTFSNADILVLEALITSSLVGIYSVAWGISTFFNIFGGAINQAVFPEISKRVAQESLETTTGIIEDAVAYAGLIIIPGVVGGIILDDWILRIYGAEFTQGTTVFWLLLLSILFHNYMRQFLNALNAIDRPALPFKINVVFIGTNLILNVILVYQFGWVGAAVASAVSTALGLVLGYGALIRITPFTLPAGEIGRQVGAAVLMGVVVWLVQTVGETAFDIGFDPVFLGGLILLGAAFYTAVLLAISTRFRTTVRRNITLN